MINGKIKCKLRRNGYEVRSDTGSRESLYVSEWDDFTRDDVNADVEAAKIALPFISAGLLSQRTSWMSGRRQLFQE